MTEPKIIPLLEDRSSAELDDRCGMRYWFYKHEGGTGIVPKKEALALTIGKQTHEDLARLAEMQDISLGALQECVEELTDGLSDEDRKFTKQMELLYRRLGWFCAWGMFIEPNIRRNYEDIGIEKDIILDRGKLWIPTTPDRVLRHKHLKDNIIYQEYKSTQRADSKWQQSWRFAIQLHIGLKAVEEEIGEKLKYAKVIGLMKGEERDGRLAHPYVYGYYNTHNGHWSCEYKTGRDWVLMPTWEYEGGILSWVDFCGPDVAKAQFPQSAPVFLDDRMLADWVRRRTLRQRKVKIVKERARIDREWRAVHFERRTGQCRPAYGDICPYLLPCWNATAELDPLGTGEFEPRQPHHEIELAGVE